MKFFALVAAASAVRLSTQNKSTGGPSAAQIIDYCDKNGDEMLTFKELVDCIMPHTPKGVSRKDVEAYVRPHFDEADTSGDGKVDLDELRAAFSKTGLAKMPTPAEVIDACDTNESGGISRKEAHACIDAHISDPEMNKKAHGMVKKHFKDVDRDGSGEVDEHELSAAMKAEEKGLAKMPTPAEVIDACDKDGSGGITRKEAHACIDAHISDPEERKKAHGMVKKHFKDVDTDGSGEVDEHELSAAMAAHEGLAQLSKGGKGPSPADIVEECDTDESGGISKDEVHACIDAHVSDPEMNAKAHEAVDEGFDYVDKDGSGEVDEKELAAAMKAHKKGGKKEKKD